MAEGSDRIRIDKWLWQARFCKTRALAAELVAAGRVRVNGQRIDKPGRSVRPGDVVTLVRAGQGRALRILACGTRRGPAAEAATLYQDTAPDPAPCETPVPPRAVQPEQPS
ncbi:RNA-binding S4 domain-containing protein [Pontitalea aquivivens]|uniref:RNA-binding S4 domain-containing protein n=1 Tax=Pontitalea aquivivens TaxID=3388663 RepID=UPI0039711275